MRSEMVLAKLLSESKAHLIPGKLAVRELFFEVPIDYSNPHLGTLRLFARAVHRHFKPTTSPTKDESPKHIENPWLLYLQGGPGGACAPPQSHPLTQVILDRGYQLLYLDQRGTGLSTPVSAATLSLKGTPEQQASYLLHFRADSIVQDCEAIRRTLTSECDGNDKKWSILGQSFGGFCALTYLSFFPSSLTEVFTLGGLAPISCTASEVYTSTFQKVIERNQAYYNKYPEDIRTIHCIASFISSKGESGISLPGGGLLTVQRFLTMGMVLGMHGGIDDIHNQILRMSSDISQFNFLTRPTLAAFEANFLSLDTGVIFALLHEPIYNQGMASKWAAYNVGLGLKEFQWLKDDWDINGSKAKWRPLFFSGEMIFPFMFETYPELRELKEVAEILARFEEWPKLYDEEALAKNDVPVYSATYIEDLYVSFPLAQETAKKVKGCKQFITNIMYHDAARTHTKEVMEKLFELRDDSID